MIVLMRHAQTDAGKGRCIGRTPVPLTAYGQEQAADAARILCKPDFARICTSPSQRAMDTVSPLADMLGVQPEVTPALDEIDMGEWDGLPFFEIKRANPEAYAERGTNFGNFQPPGGESFNDVADRTYILLSRLACREGHVLAVTHAGVIRSLLCRVTGHPMNDPFHFTPGYTRCSVFTWVKDSLRLVAADLSPKDVADSLSA